MTRSIAFYAPLKSPNHATPSGDRTMARGLMNALAEIGEVSLVSEFRSRDGAGNQSVQQSLIAQANAEVSRLCKVGGWDAWVTYHNYYKAPDLIGPAVCKVLDIPYHVVEASRATKRHTGSWAEFAKRAEAGIDAAAIIYCFTERDRPMLQKHLMDGQKIVSLKPFLDQTTVPDLPELSTHKTMLAVGMFRKGDKLASYTNLSNAMALLPNKDWKLKIVGGGEAEMEVRALFAPFGENAEFLGTMTADQVQLEMAQANVFVWPGVNEAFGMVYLEAQAMGLPVVAEDRVGVRDVVGPHSQLTPCDDPDAFAQAIERTFSDIQGAKHQDYIKQNHLRPSAVNTLRNSMQFGGAQT